MYCIISMLHKFVLHCVYFCLIHTHTHTQFCRILLWKYIMIYILYHISSICNLKLRIQMHLFLGTGVQFMRGYAFISLVFWKRHGENMCVLNKCCCGCLCVGEGDIKGPVSDLFKIPHINCPHYLTDITEIGALRNYTCLWQP